MTVLSLAGWQPYAGPALAGPPHAPQLLPADRRPLPGRTGDAGRGLDLRGLRRGAGRGRGSRRSSRRYGSSSTPPAPAGLEAELRPALERQLSRTEHRALRPPGGARRRSSATRPGTRRTPTRPRRPASSRSRTSTASTTSSASATAARYILYRRTYFARGRGGGARGLRPSPPEDARAAGRAAHEDAGAHGSAVGPQPTRTTAWSSAASSSRGPSSPSPWTWPRWASATGPTPGWWSPRTSPTTGARPTACASPSPPGRSDGCCACSSASGPADQGHPRASSTTWC